MNQKVLHTLEFDKIIALVAAEAGSEAGIRKCRELKPGTDLAQIRMMQQQTTDAVNRLRKKAGPFFGQLRDIRPAVMRLDIGAILSCEELLQIAAVLDTAASARRFLRPENDEEPADSLTVYYDSLDPCELLSGEIRRCILAFDEIADDASPKLKDIRRRQNLAKLQIQKTLSSMVSSNAMKMYLQDSVVTMRNGRYCIPVKQEHRSHVPGMVHDQSGSGSTVFIEPMAVVRLNNDLKELSLAEEEEIQVILSHLSNMAAAKSEALKADQELLTDLDVIIAKARYSEKIRGCAPLFHEDRYIDLHKARHPLIDPKKAVPVDLTLGREFDMLIVTGPNTGGKTVSLKTTGLICLMGQAGLHIPALDGSSLCIFEEVYADIGDEQSIEQNLSTFSSHMSNIVYIIDHASMNSLCLFDELGGGTDPVEGAALAIAILNHLKNMGARCMATTHYSELKTYALSTDGVENASCEFDIKTLQPTYKLMIGIPGKSNAFAISKKLGLPDYIIDSAKENVDSDSVDMESLIADLEKSKKSIEEDERAIEQYKKEVEELKLSLEEKEKNIKEKKADILAEARMEASEIIDEAKELADKTIRDYNKWRNNPEKADMRIMEEKRGKLRDKLKSYDQGGKKEVPKRTSHHKAKDFHIGDMVEVISMDARGTITALPDANGIAGVKMGILNSRLPISDLIIIPDEKPKQSYGVKAKNSAIKGKAMFISPEINVIGKTVDEAISLIDKYLDDAALSHLEKVTIIHGKGTGALRNGIHQYLKTHPLVKSFRAGEYGEGEYGVTIVEF